MTQEVLPTEFEPAARIGSEVLVEQLDRLKADPLMTSVANGTAAFISILNPSRQIVFANKLLTETFGVTLDEAVGQRTGEVMDCGNASIGPGGCGTSRACSACGSGKVLRQARLGNAHEEECRILRADGSSIDLKVAATPISINDETFVLFTALDISDEKRRRSLERIFFHDIMNTATGVRGLSSMARILAGEERDEMLELLEHTSDHLIGEIEGQRELLAAESNELVVHPQLIESGRLLLDLANLYSAHDVATGKSIVMAATHDDVAFVADPVLLGRVIGNLTKNALEASSPGGSVMLSCTSEGSLISFSVHNQGVIPERSQLQIFQRSFTTKGEGRGLGTYGSRLLTERYLGGRLSFESSEAAGTTFTVDLPFIAGNLGVRNALPADLRP